jgi:formiminoglutamase
MELLKVYDRAEILSHTRVRSGEIKIGEMVQAVNNDWQKEVNDSTAAFVMLGIPEDIGVRANLGRPGAGSAFKPALDSFLNQQSNIFFDGSSVLVLGEIFVDDLLKKADAIGQKGPDAIIELRQLVSELDDRVAAVISTVIGAGKIPLIIGGGHNNSYGNIKGASQAMKREVNAINCDPHLDFREQEGRHSGNGFSYAFHEGYISRYSVFGIHEQYNNKAALSDFSAHPSRLFFHTYESVYVAGRFSFLKALKQCISFVGGVPCGVELDLDAITNVPSSAKTSSGISPRHARKYVYECAVSLDCLYLHIAEGAPVLSHIKADNKTGKLIAYLLTDFIKGVTAAKLRD